MSRFFIRDINEWNMILTPLDNIKYKFNGYHYNNKRRNVSTEL